MRASASRCLRLSSSALTSASFRIRSIKENGEKLSASDKAPLEAAVTKAREAAKGEDVDAITSAHDALEQAAHALTKVLYEATAARGGTGAEPGAAAGPKPAADDTIDAEFEVKKDG